MISYIGEFIPVPVKAGSLLLIHGEVLHRSKVNVSPKSRNAYTFHVYDGGVSKWSNENWLVFSLLIIFHELKLTQSYI